MRRILDQEGPVVCDVKITPNQTTAPRASSRQRADGSMESAPMEDLWPFLDREDFRRQMFIPPLEHSGWKIWYNGWRVGVASAL